MNEIQEFLMPVFYGSIAFITLNLAWDAFLRLLRAFVGWLAGE